VSVQGPGLVVAHLVRRAGEGGGPVESDVATILRVEDRIIAEFVSASCRALDDYWAEASTTSE
jgi:hypothetical protein